MANVLRKTINDILQDSNVETSNPEEKVLDLIKSAAIGRTGEFEVATPVGTRPGETLADKMGPEWVTRDKTPTLEQGPIPWSYYLGQMGEAIKQGAIDEYGLATGGWGDLSEQELQEQYGITPGAEKFQQAEGKPSYLSGSIKRILEMLVQPENLAIEAALATGQYHLLPGLASKLPLLAGMAGFGDDFWKMKKRFGGKAQAEKVANLRKELEVKVGDIVSTEGPLLSYGPGDSIRLSEKQLAKLKKTDKDLYDDYLDYVEVSENWPAELAEMEYQQSIDDFSESGEGFQFTDEYLAEQEALGFPPTERPKLPVSRRGPTEEPKFMIDEIEQGILDRTVNRPLGTTNIDDEVLSETILTRGYWGEPKGTTTMKDILEGGGSYDGFNPKAYFDDFSEVLQKELGDDLGDLHGMSKKELNKILNKNPHQRELLQSNLDDAVKRAEDIVNAKHGQPPQSVGAFDVGIDYTTGNVSFGSPKNIKKQFGANFTTSSSKGAGTFIEKTTERLAREEMEKVGKMNFEQIQSWASENGVLGKMDFEGYPTNQALVQGNRKVFEEIGEKNAEIIIEARKLANDMMDEGAEFKNFARKNFLDIKNPTVEQSSLFIEQAKQAKKTLKTMFDDNYIGGPKRKSDVDDAVERILKSEDPGKYE